MAGARRRRLLRMPACARPAIASPPRAAARIADAVPSRSTIARPGGSSIPRRVARCMRPWQRHSEPGPAARAEAVVAPPGTNRPGCARSRQGTEFAESRFRASRVTLVRRQRPYRRSPRSRSSGCCSARRSGHLIAAAISAAPFRPEGQPGERSRGLVQSQAEQARRRLERDGGKPPARVRDLQCGLNLSVRKSSVCGASDRRCVTLASCATANQKGLPRTGCDFGGRQPKCPPGKGRLK